MESERIITAFLLTLFAGLSTGIGSLIMYVSRGFNPRILSATLGFSAGVMIFVSFVEILSKARISLQAIHGEKTGYGLTLLFFFIGIIIIALIDRLVPSYENPHEIRNIKEVELKDKNKLLRMGLFSALAIAIHNFPEGLATFMAALSDPKVGYGIAVAIAIHNIPEGMVVSTPIYYATKSKKKAFWLSFLSGLAEPLGALLGYFLLKRYLTDDIFGAVFASVAGIMVYISLDELLPTAEEYGEHHIAIGGVMIGMAVMAASLYLFV